MTRKHFPALAALGAAWLTAAGCAVAGHPTAVRPLILAAAPNKPAFLDAADTVTVAMDQPVSAASLLGHVSVRCGGATVLVAKVETVPDKAEEVVLAGTFQSKLGGSDWSTDDPRTQMIEVAPSVYEFQTRLPQGSYQYKIARGGSWAENYGAGSQPSVLKPNGDNIPLVVPADNTPVRFRADLAKHTLQTTLGTAGPALAKAAQTDTSRILRLTLGRRLTPGDIAKPLTLRLPDGTERMVYAREALSGPEYVYSGGDLGASYTPAATAFKVWSPVSSSAEVLLYHTATGASYRQVPMSREAHGVWAASVPGELGGVYYQYRFTSYGTQQTAPDIYCRAASADLSRSMVVDLARTDPANWKAVPAPTLAAPTDAVLYEAHVRDFTIDPSSGVPSAERGTYLGLAALGTVVPDTSTPTGLDYLRRLGVTHIHLLPFQSIAPDGGGLSTYNWGYATDLFNVPEPRYGLHPDDPASVIRDVKTMVLGLHQAHLGLVMDVVYNHSVPSSGDGSPFWAAVPYYYFRTNAQGDVLNESGVGNALDDDHPMVRKYISDSLVYWATEYRADGFRFDQMGMFTPETIRALSETLHKLRPDILLYGEPWTGGGPLRFGKGAQRGLKMAVFNDTFRNVMQGEVSGPAAGFTLGGGADPAALESALRGSPEFASAPTESINYVSIHDNLSLWDKITLTLPKSDALDRQSVKLAGAMVLLSQGVPILEGGAEMGRTKGGNGNSYNAGDSVNRFDWARGQTFADVSDYYRGLIAVRKAHPAFRCATTAEVAQTLTFLPVSALPPKTTAFVLDGTATRDPWRKTLVIFHGETTPTTFTLPLGRWHLAVSGDHAGTEGAVVNTVTIPLAPLSATVLYQ